MVLFFYRFVRFAILQNDESRRFYTIVDKLAELLGGILIIVWARRKRNWLVHFYWLALLKLLLYAVIILNIVPGFDANLKEMEKIGMQSNQRVGPFLYFIPVCLFQYRIGLYVIYPAIFVYQVLVLFDADYTPENSTTGYIRTAAWDFVQLLVFVAQNYIISDFFTRLCYARYFFYLQQKQLRSLIEQQPDAAILYKVDRPGFSENSEPSAKYNLDSRVN